MSTRVAATIHRTPAAWIGAYDQRCIAGELSNAIQELVASLAGLDTALQDISEAQLRQGLFRLASIDNRLELIATNWIRETEQRGDLTRVQVSLAAALCVATRGSGLPGSIAGAMGAEGLLALGVRELSADPVRFHREFRQQIPLQMPIVVRASTSTTAPTASDPSTARTPQLWRALDALSTHHQARSRPPRENGSENGPMTVREDAYTWINTSQDAQQSASPPAQPRAPRAPRAPSPPALPAYLKPSIWFLWASRLEREVVGLNIPETDPLSVGVSRAQARRLRDLAPEVRAELRSDQDQMQLLAAHLFMRHGLVNSFVPTNQFGSRFENCRLLYILMSSLISAHLRQLSACACVRLHRKKLNISQRICLAFFESSSLAQLEICSYLTCANQ